MREILFRGRCIDYDDIYGWVEGYYIHLQDVWKNRNVHRIYNGFSESDSYGFYPDYYKVDPETVGQFTGLLDKNGKKIFEGDIVKRNSVSMLVVWNEACAMFEVEYIMDGERYCNTLFGHEILEVIGNIHDNPELLE